MLLLLDRVVWKWIPRPYAPRDLVASTPKVRRRDWKCTLLFRRRNAPMVTMKSRFYSFWWFIHSRGMLRLRENYVYVLPTWWMYKEDLIQRRRIYVSFREGWTDWWLAFKACHRVFWNWRLIFLSIFYCLGISSRLRSLPRFILIYIFYYVHFIIRLHCIVL